MPGVDSARHHRRGVRVDTVVPQLFRKALAIAEEVIPVRVEATPIVIAPGEGQMDMRMVPVDVERRHPRPVCEFFSREVQRCFPETFRIGPRRHRQEH